jgi:hypothetical protein
MNGLGAFGSDPIGAEANGQQLERRRAMADDELRNESGNPPMNGEGGPAVPSPAPETTFDRAESLPDQTQPAPEPTPSQAAVDLDDALASAIAPDDEDVDLSEAELGPPRYTTVPRKISPPRMIPIRIFPKAAGSMTVFMLSVAREAQDDGDQDTYPLGQSVRVQLAGHPAFQKHIRRYQIRLGVTSLGRPFFLEVNLDDQGIWGQSRRDLVARAETEWVMVSSDRSTGYVYYPADHFDDPVMPEQGFAELCQLTYKPCLIGSLDHPIIKRGALRKTAKK